uniref:hypothetical protein n=1 Tax=Frisingicoccus sp. TaxID=1918627 RepID=UPI003AB4ED56
DMRDARMGIPYRAKLDEARPCAASDIRDARMGIPYRAELDVARPCAASDMRDARMGMHFQYSIVSLENLEILLVERSHFGYTIINDKIMIKLR